MNAGLRTLGRLAPLALFVLGVARAEDAAPSILHTGAPAGGVFRLEATLPSGGAAVTGAGVQAESAYAVFVQQTNPGKVTLYGRYAKLEEPVRIALRMSDGEVLSLVQKISEGKKPDDAKALEAGWARALIEDYLGKARGPNRSFYQYAAYVTAERHGLQRVLKSLDQTADVFNNPFRREPDLYGMMTGALAIQESLQLDALRNPRASDTAYATPLASLEPPEVRSHPFKEMVKGRTVAACPLSRFAPPDFFYVRARGVDALLGLLEKSDAWGGHLMKHYAVSSVDRLLKEKFEAQWALKSSPLLRPFYGLAIEEAALVGSDPFFAEGTDLTMIFRLKQDDLFKAKLGEYRKDYRKEYPDAVEETVKIEGLDVIHLGTPDRVVDAYQAFPEKGLAVVSNSAKAMERILRVVLKKEPSLGDSDEFKYIRSVFPADQDAEDVFVYLSDPFIRALVSPRSKILEQRRIRAFNVLKMIENAALLHFLERQERAGSIDALIREKYLDEKGLRDPFGGTFALDKDGLTAVSSELGRLRRLRSVLELPIDKVSKEEEAAYRDFSRRYQSYWREFFDPIAIRVSMKGGFSMETVILPLLDNSIYRNLAAFAGGPEASLEGGFIPENAIFTCALKVNDPKPLAEAAAPLLDRIGWKTEEDRARFAGIFGGDAAVGFCDHDLLFGYHLGDSLAQSLRRGSALQRETLAAPLLMALNLPVFASIPVKDAKGFGDFLRDFKAHFTRARSEGERAGGFGIEVDPYALKSPGGAAYEAVRIKLFNSVTARVFYAVRDGRLYAASRKSALEDLLDQPARSGDEAVKGHVHAEFRVDRYRDVLPDFEQAWAESGREACLRNLDAQQLIADLFPSEPGALAKLAPALEGVRYFCPEAGAYDVNANGLCRCSVHGTGGAPAQPSRPSGPSPFKNVGRISLTLKFIPEGLYTQIRITEKARPDASPQTPEPDH